MRAKQFLNEDWNKVNKKDKTDGLSQKAVNAYRRENPGSKLQTAVTTKPSKLKAGSKDAKRRKSFCARMSGNKGPMKDEKGRPTPKAKALRRWNCEEDIQHLEAELAEQAIAEKWTQKYKKSINCSHPKGFSQKAHCAGKKKHNESTEMEMTCPDCGMCETHGNNMMEVKQRLDAKCWKGKHKEGTKIKGGVRVNNCVPNESGVNEMDSQGYRGVRDDDYDYGKGKWTQGKMMTAKDATKHAKTELDKAFSDTDKLKKAVKKVSKKVSEGEGETVKNSLHTIVRVASHLDKSISNDEEFPEWVSEKIGSIKDQIVSVMDFEISDEELNGNLKGSVAEGKTQKQEAPKPRNFVAKNAINTGAGAHKDKKKAEKQGDVKHKGKMLDLSEMEDILERASRQLCKSSTPDKDLGASNLASCKSQGYRARDGEKSHLITSGNRKVRITVGGKKIKGKKYGGPLPDYGTRK